MTQDGEPGKALSVLKGGRGKNESPVAAGDTQKKGDKKESTDDSGGDAKLSTLIHTMAKHMIQQTPSLGAFPHRYHVLPDHEGECFILESNENGEVRRVSNNSVAHSILKFIADEKYAFGFSKLNHNHMAVVIHDFMARAPRIAPPAIVLQKSEEGLTYRKLPFDFEDDPGLGRSPTFKEMMARTTNWQALMRWIGSLFDAEADMQQYVWLYGGGQNGKSSLGRFLGQVLGNGARFMQPPAPSDRFWTINLIGKRLVIYADCNNARFVTSGLFKSMTGGDAVQAEIKMGAMLNVVLQAKHLFFSNKKPAIDGGDADQRRIILCEMSPIKGLPDPRYEDKLWMEGATFLGECIRMYREDAGPRRRIPCEQDAARELAFENDDVFETVFGTHFVLRPGGWVPAHRFVERLQAAGIKSPQDVARFREFVERCYGVKRERIAGHGFKYSGITENPGR